MSTSTIGALPIFLWVVIILFILVLIVAGIGLYRTRRHDGGTYSNTSTGGVPNDAAAEQQRGARPPSSSGSTSSGYQETGSASGESDGRNRGQP